MNKEFQKIVESLEIKFQQLVNSQPVKYSQLPRDLPKRAIYLFSEDDSHQYVGRTNNLRGRLSGHCRPSSSHNSATLAFRIARVRTGIIQASYSKIGSRQELCADPIFGPAFIAAKQMVSEMDIRFIEVSDPITQALLEIYVAMSLKTPFNDFENH